MSYENIRQQITVFLGRHPKSSPFQIATATHIPAFKVALELARMTWQGDVELADYSRPTCSGVSVPLYSLGHNNARAAA